MAAQPKPTPEAVRNAHRIPMNIGTELRIKPSGDISISNPPAEPPLEATAEAVISYHFDPQTGDHVIRLVEPLMAKPRP